MLDTKHNILFWQIFEYEWGNVILQHYDLSLGASIHIHTNITVHTICHQSGPDLGLFISSTPDRDL